MIHVQQALKQFDDKVALDIPDLEIRMGECVGIVGNNGAGKTTLFRAMLDLLPLDSGQSHWMGAASRSQITGRVC